MERFKIPDDQPMEASILSRQIENAQKKVEEQNFVSRKNVLKYDDVMNSQRVVIYDQRRRVLEGDDLSDEIEGWIEEVIGANVSQFTDAETTDEWDLAGLVTQMHALYGTDITVEELSEEVDVTSRDALVEEFVGDALDTYAEREESFGPELMSAFSSESRGRTPTRGSSSRRWSRTSAFPKGTAATASSTRRVSGRASATSASTTRVSSTPRLRPGIESPRGSGRTRAGSPSSRSPRFAAGSQS